jgi:hypothetical protein
LTLTIGSLTMSSWKPARLGSTQWARSG